MVGEFTQSIKSSLAICTTHCSHAGRLEIGVLKQNSSTLTYLGGNCSWIVTTIILDSVQDILLGVGSERVLDARGGDDDLMLRCVDVEDGTVKLDAVVKIHR